jgi:hypothetical protein
VRLMILLALVTGEEDVADIYIMVATEINDGYMYIVHGNPILTYFGGQHYESAGTSGHHRSGR